VPPPNAPPAAATPVQEKTKQEKPLTNKKIWDRVLSNHPEQHDTTHGDLLYEYSRKARSFLLLSPPPEEISY
jgi:hypothetical protein